MNKYQIQIDHRTENKWDWICVFANSDQEVIQNAKIKLYNFQNPIYSQSDDYDTKYYFLLRQMRNRLSYFYVKSN